MLLALEINKIEVKMNKPLYLHMLILDTSNIVIYEYWYDYIKLKYRGKAKLCHTETGSFIVHVKS